jgi:hypothetical protein
MRVDDVMGNVLVSLPPEAVTTEAAASSRRWPACMRSNVPPTDTCLNPNPNGASSRAVRATAAASTSAAPAAPPAAAAAADAPVAVAKNAAENASENAAAPLSMSLLVARAPTPGAGAGAASPAVGCTTSTSTAGALRAARSARQQSPP